MTLVEGISRSQRFEPAIVDAYFSVVAILQNAAIML